MSSKAVAAAGVTFSIERSADQSHILVAVLATIAVYFLIYPVWRSQFLFEIWFTEGWNAYFQDAAASGGLLYPPANGLVVNNYPPLSFYAIEWLAKLNGVDVLFMGRALSLTALLVVAAEVFLCVRILTGNTLGAAIGASWYTAIMAHNFTAYIGANDPQIVGEAIMGAGLVLFLKRESEQQPVTAALLVMTVGGFWKHSMIAIPLAAVIWLFVRRGSAAWRPVAISAVVCVVGLAACTAIFGSQFLESLFATRLYSFGHLVSQLGRLQWPAPALIIWMIWAARTRDYAARFTRVHVPIAFAACILQWCGDGVFGTAEFDLMIALGIAMGACFASAALPARAIVVTVLALRLVATDRHEPLLVMFDPGFTRRFLAAQEQTRLEIRQVAAIDGDVYCSNKVVCRAAGKRFVVDDFTVEQLEATGTVTQADIERLLQLQGIKTVVNSAQTAGAISTSLSKALAR